VQPDGHPRTRRGVVVGLAMARGMTAPQPLGVRAPVVSGDVGGHVAKRPDPGGQSVDGAGAPGLPQLVLGQGDALHRCVGELDRSRPASQGPRDQVLQ